MTVRGVVVLVSLMLAPDAAWAQSAERPIATRAESDQTIDVSKGTRVELDDCAGEAIVRTWNRDAVRVRARHGSRTRVEANLQGTLLRIDTDANRGSGVADFELTVPVWIALRIDGRNCFIDVEGVAGAVSADTVEGDIHLRGLTGAVDAETIEGRITLEGGRGRAQLSTVNGTIAIVKAGGEIVAESVNGNVTIADTPASAIEVSTVDGDISFSGAFQPSGRYMFGTHDGDVVLTIPENSGATLAVRTMGDGRVESALPLKQASPGRRGQRSTYTLGNGSAQVDIEAFDGTVRIRRP